MKEAIALFDNTTQGLAAALAKLDELGKLWHLDDLPSECGFNDEEVALLTKFQDDLWLWADANDVNPFEYYPNID